MLSKNNHGFYGGFKMLKFFTDRTVKNEFLLIKITNYFKLKDYSKWKEIFIDPGIFELTKDYKFSWEGKINIKEFLDSLPDNHYFSLDYPGDMNLNYLDLFIYNSLNNAKMFCYHSQYIVTVQYKFNHYWNFTKWFNKYNKLEIASRIMGLGNLCRFRSLNQYLKHTLDYAFSHCKHPRIHIYGLCLKAIPYAVKLAKRFNIELSVDSTKWTRPCTVELKKLCGLWFKHEYRQNCFDAYLDEIIKRGVKLENKNVKY